MKKLKYLLMMVLLGLALFGASLALFTVGKSASAAAAQTFYGDEGELQGGFTADGSALNAMNSDGSTPALAVSAGGDLWSALIQDQRVVVKQFVTTTMSWSPKGTSPSSGVAASPAIGFRTDQPNSPWLAWSEGQNSPQMVKAAHFDGANWQAAGSLNVNLAATAQHVALAIGRTPSSTVPLPWVAWDEHANNDHRAIIVKAALSDTNGPAGVTWQMVGDPLRLNAESDAMLPDLAFVGPGNTEPWLVWQENSDATTALFAARGVTDAMAAGGLQWQVVGKSSGCTGAACTLNSNTDASALHVATGVLLGESVAKPWLVYAEQITPAQSAIRVLRLDDGDTPADPTDDRFIAVGDAANQQCLRDAGLQPESGAQPDIFFVGRVPHIAWIETQPLGAQLFVCHLADSRPGQERWDLDTNAGINRNGFVDAAHPVLASDGNTPFVAWQEGNTTQQVYVAHRFPNGPAWGSNRPPFIRTISWSRNFVGSAAGQQGIAEAIHKSLATTNILTLTTSCDHVDGWENINEIQFKVANSQLIAFAGKYVAAEDKVYVEDPEHPGVFLGGVQPGSNVQPIETTNAILYPALMRVRSHGTNSPAVDIVWRIAFKEPTMFQDLKQNINIVYANGEQTGFFETGLLSFDYRIYLPSVAH